MCIAPQALLGALVASVRDRGHRVTRQELETLLAARCSRSEIASALARARSHPGADLGAIDEAERALASITA